MNFRKGSLRRAIFLIAFGVLLYAAVQNLSAVWSFLRWVYGLISPIVLGLCIAFVLNVLMRFFENRVFAAMGRSSRERVQKLRRPLSLIVTFLTILAAIALVLLVVVPGIEDTVNSLVSSLPGYMQRCLDWMTAMLSRLNISPDIIAELKVDWNNVAGIVFDVLKNGTGSIFDTATVVTTSLFDGLVEFVLGLFLAIYILLDKERIGRFAGRAVRAFLPAPAGNKIEEIAQLSNTAFSNFITGQLLEAMILAGLCFVGMLIFRFPYAAIVSVLIGVTALIPIFGAWIGGGISAFLILMVSPLKALLFLVFLLVLQQLENNLIYPRVVGRKMGLPGILVLIAIIIGGNLGGVGTMLVSVPICAVLYTLLQEQIEYLLRRRAAALTVVPSEVSVPAAERPAPVESPAVQPRPAATKREKKQKRKK